jgi:ketosteroid isomerase-like protein
MMPGPQSEREILAANTQFYRAFSDGDFRAMTELWAARSPLACLHPGQPVLLGREAVLRAWRDILKHTSGAALSCREPRVQVFGETAIVYCYEAVGAQPAHLAATNVFTREDGTWKMVHHHAGPLAEPRISPSIGHLN